MRITERGGIVKVVRSSASSFFLFLCTSENCNHALVNASNFRSCLIMEGAVYDPQNWKTHFIAAGLYDGLEDACLGQLLVLLKSANADPNFILPRKGIAPIHFAVGIEQLNFAEEATKLLLCYGANPNARTVDGQTPVHIAAAWGRINILYCLLANGGDPWLRDNDNKDAFDYAYEEEHWDAVALLKEFENGEICSKANCSRTYLTFEKLLIHKGNMVLEYGANTENFTNKYQVKSVATQTDLPDQLHEPSRKAKKQQESYFHKRSTSNYKLETTDCISLQQAELLYSDAACKPVDRNCRTDRSLKPSEEELLRMKSNLITELKSLHLISNSLEAPEKKNETENEGKLFTRNKHQESYKHVFKHNFKRVLHNGIIRNTNEMKHGEKSENIVRLPDSSITLNSLQCYPVESSVNEPIPLITKEDSKIQNFKPELDMSDTLFPSDEEQTASHSCFSCSENKNSFQMQFTGSKSCASVTEHMSCKHKTCTCLSLVNNSNVSCKQLNLEELSDKVCHSSSGSETDFFTQQSYETAAECLAEAQTYVSVSEEYSYTDEEKRMTLLERRLLVPTFRFSDFTQVECDEDSKDSSKEDSSCSSNEIESDVSIPSSLEYATDSLRKKLVERGYVPGPITTTTKKVYLKKLLKLDKHKAETHHASASSTRRTNERVYSQELQKTLKNSDWQSQMTEYILLEKLVVQQFSEKNNQKSWREGVIKSSFAYILLDPRITNNLPHWASSCSRLEVWTKFLSAVFYIGKGKRSRPYSHLYEAFAYWRKNCYSSVDAKMQYILDIWKDGLGVICLHVFQHVIPVEAYTREAAMIDAIGLRNLKNNRSGEYYGIAASWTSHQKRKWGTYLLYRAFCIFLLEGERQLRPSDIGS